MIWRRYATWGTPRWTELGVACSRSARGGALSWVTVTEKTWQVQICVVSVTLSVAFGSPGIVLQGLSTQTQKASGTMYSSKRMADGKQWMTHNLDVDTMPSYCYEDAEPNCR